MPGYYSGCFDGEGWGEGVDDSSGDYDGNGEGNGISNYFESFDGSGEEYSKSLMIKRWK